MAKDEWVGETFLNRILGLRPAARPSDESLVLEESAGEYRAPSPLRTQTVVQRLSQGLPASSFVVLCDAFQLPQDRMAEAVNIAPRTLARRKVFKPDESERIFRFGRIFQDAVDLFDGKVDEAREWLKQPQFGLGGAVPLEFARTEPGAQEVRALIARLNEGIFA